MATQVAKTIDFLCLDKITLQEVSNRKYSLELFLGNRAIELQTKDNQIWTPVQRPVVSLTSRMHMEVRRKSGHLLLAKKEQTNRLINLSNLFDNYWTSKALKLMVSEVVVIGKHTCSLELQFSVTVTAESLRSSAEELEELLRNYSPLMSPSTERALERVIKFGAALSESNDIAKAVFSVVEVAFEILKEQNKYDQIASGLFDRLQRIVSLAEKVADEIVCDDTEILEMIVPRMFEVMQTTMKVLCDYVKRGRFERIKDGLIHSKENDMIEKMAGELADVIEDFMRAVNVEALCLAKESEQALLLGGLEHVKTGYHQGLRCMEGTRKSLLKEIMDWVTNKPRQEDDLQSNTYWLYGSPGIGKTSLAHSICAGLHDREQLAGAFFCRKDDINLSEPRNILPTLTYKLARTFPPFRRIVAKRLRNDPHLTAESMKDSLFLDFIRSVPHHPKHPLVFVIDALDECGSTRNRPGILKALTDAAREASWLKIIITSRPEVDIQRFFDSLSHLSQLRRDLARDQEASADLRTFAQNEFDSVASKWYLSTPWPEESLFNTVISRANGLFIFIKTLVLTLEQSKDPESLKATIRNSDGSGSGSLYGLYSSILTARIPPSNPEFQRVIDVLLTTAPYRPLRDETIAELAGVPPNLVKKWMDDLSSLLYRDEWANGGIRVRHLSISDFFFSDDCQSHYQVNVGDANLQLGIACLKTLVDQLRFNICKLEDSRLANADIKDLQSRIVQNISEALQYSSLYWSNHLGSIHDNDDRRVWENLKEFFAGLYPIFWIEVLSIMGAVPIGAPSLRRMASWVKDADLTLRERIEDICRFIITFHTPVSTSAPHTYISTQPFLPSQSPLSTVFSTWFIKTIKMKKGKLLSWPAPPLQWIGHTNTVHGMNFSPDGCRVVTGSDDKTIRIWDFETGAVVGEPLKGHSGGVLSVAYSPDARHIISGSRDTTIRIWNAETGAVVDKPMEGHTGSVWSVAYSPDGRHIVSGSDDKTIRIWDPEASVAVGKPLEGHTDRVWSIAYSPDGRYIMSGSLDETIRIWDAETGTMVGEPLVGRDSPVTAIVYSPDGQYIISGFLDGTIEIWSAKSSAFLMGSLGHNDYAVYSLAYSPDGRHFISGSGDMTIRIWDAETGARVGNPLKGHTLRIHTVAYSPDGQHIISGSADKTIRTWDAETGAAGGKPLEGHAGSVRSIGYSPDGKRTISGSEDGTVRIWDARTGVAIGKPLEGHTDWVQSVAYSPNGRHVVSGSDDYTIRIWDVQKGVAVGKPLRGHFGWVRSVAYSPDGKHIVSGSEDHTIRIWGAKAGALVGEPLMGHSQPVLSVVYSPDGRHIISGSNDRTIRIWNSKTGAVVGKPMEGHTADVCSVAYSPNGRHIISGSSDSTIRIWDAETGAVVSKPLEGHTECVCSVAYSPDGRHITSGSDDSTIRIWDAETGAAVGTPLKGHSGPVLSIAYSPDGQHIISGSDDWSIHMWDSFSHPSISPPPSANPTHALSSAEPAVDSSVRDSDGGLLYWVPPDCCSGLNSPALLTIPSTSHTRSVSLDFEDFAFGTSWTQIFNGPQL